MTLMPEHDKREQSSTHLHPDVLEAFKYVESVSKTADYPLAHAWHGWALREAFLAGVSYAQKEPK